MPRTSAVMLAVLALLVAPVAQARAQSAPSVDPYASETKEQRDLRMRWWREARFGMFIHWGVYSVPAGTHQGRRIGGIGEWIMHHARIPCAEYQQYAKRFNPVRFDADAWVRLAKAAGMRYIVITAKHHDGFALFPSEASRWDIADATPFGRDPLEELAAACRRHGIRLGFYYSQAQDWNHPGGAAAGGHWDPAQHGDMTEYIRRVAAPQVRELLTSYGRIAVLWWDTPVDMTKERADLLLPLLRLQPGIVHNNRLGGGYSGDFQTPEQYVPATGYPGRDWETCMTMNDTWGYKSDDHNWKSTETLIRTLIDIASKGGNFLLNVGPTSEGLIPQPSVDRLRTVGAWMRTNGSAIYATSAGPFRRLAWGRCTQRRTARGGTLFFHVWDWPADGRLLVPGLRCEVTSARVLATRARVRTRQTEQGLELTLPATAPDPVSSTVVVEWRGMLHVEQPAAQQAAEGPTELRAVDAEVHGTQAQYESGAQRDSIGFWLDPADWVSWRLVVRRAGRYRVEAVLAGPGGSLLDISFGGRRVRATSPSTGDYGRFETVLAGEVDLTAGTVSVEVRPVAAGWQPVNLRAIRLVPVP
ncbi:MAG TPA: alpha-L-fucosidase [Chthonomonadales bacterium]|nr:alpha-L-fucosidase [Chthonomonadales bacterium]